MIYVYLFTLIWIMCAAEDFYYPYNLSRSTVAESARIAAVRKSLTLDWLAAEDIRQRGLVAAFQTDAAPLLRMVNTDCIAYPIPSSGKIGRLMLELLKNLEGDDSNIITELIQVLVNAKLLVETSALEVEPDFEALIKTPNVMMGEPHTTFPRILSMAWMMATDPPTVVKQGWCPISKVSKYLKVSRPTQVAKHMKMLDIMISRTRYVMEDFIQNVTPLNMYQKKTTKSNNQKTEDIGRKPVKRPMRAHDIERESLEQLLPTTRMQPNTTSFEAERLPNLDLSRGNAMFVTAGASTLSLCRFVNALGNMLWITMMIYDL